MTALAVVRADLPEADRSIIAFSGRFLALQSEIENRCTLGHRTYIADDARRSLAVQHLTIRQEEIASQISDLTGPSLAALAARAAALNAADWAEPWGPGRLLLLDSLLQDLLTIAGSPDGRF